MGHLEGRVEVRGAPGRQGEGWGAPSEQRLEGHQVSRVETGGHPVDRVEAGGHRVGFPQMSTKQRRGVSGAGRGRERAVGRVNTGWGNCGANHVMFSLGPKRQETPL